MATPLRVKAAQRRHVLGRHADLFGPATVADPGAQAPGTRTGCDQSLKHDVRRDGIVSCADRRIAAHPVADLELGGVVADGSHAADGPGTGHGGKFERIGALARKHLARIRQHEGGEDIHDHLAGTEHGRRHVAYRDRRANSFEDNSFHVATFGVLGRSLAPQPPSVQTWHHPRINRPYERN